MAKRRRKKKSSSGCSSILGGFIVIGCIIAFVQAYWRPILIIGLVLILVAALIFYFRYSRNGASTNSSGNTGSSFLSNNQAGVRNITQNQTGLIRNPHSGSSDFDHMSGIEFENYCARLLQANGFANVRLTKATGDQGIDIVATKNNIKYGIQCKRYKSNLGNKPVQEVYAGISIYKCDRGAVLTNSHFTDGAKAAAKSLGIELWDRNKLLDFAIHANSIGVGVAWKR